MSDNNSELGILKEIVSTISSTVGQLDGLITQAKSMSSGNNVASLERTKISNDTRRTISENALLKSNERNKSRELITENVTTRKQGEWNNRNRLANHRTQAQQDLVSQRSLMAITTNSNKILLRKSSQLLATPNLKNENNRQLANRVFNDLSKGKSITGEDTEALQKAHADEISKTTKVLSQEFKKLAGATAIAAGIMRIGSYYNTYNAQDQANVLGGTTGLAQRNADFNNQRRGMTYSGVGAIAGAIVGGIAGTFLGGNTVPGVEIGMSAGIAAGSWLSGTSDAKEQLKQQYMFEQDLAKNTNNHNVEYMKDNIDRLDPFTQANIYQATALPRQLRGGYAGNVTTLLPTVAQQSLTSADYNQLAQSNAFVTRGNNVMGNTNAINSMLNQYTNTANSNSLDLVQLQMLGGSYGAMGIKNSLGNATNALKYGDSFANAQQSYFQSSEMDKYQKNIIAKATLGVDLDNAIKNPSSGDAQTLNQLNRNNVNSNGKSLNIRDIMANIVSPSFITQGANAGALSKNGNQNPVGTTSQSISEIAKSNAKDFAEMGKTIASTLQDAFNKGIYTQSITIANRLSYPPSATKGAMF